MGTRPLSLATLPSERLLINCPAFTLPVAATDVLQYSPN